MSNQGMQKHLYSGEFELNCPPKKVFPFLNSPEHIDQWLVEKAFSTNEDNSLYCFSWENEEYTVKMSNHKTNEYVRYEFLNDNHSGNHSYIEFRLDNNELTRSTFLTVNDYSELQNQEEFDNLWHPLIDRLRKLVGG